MRRKTEKCVALTTTRKANFRPDGYNSVIDSELSSVIPLIK